MTQAFKNSQEIAESALEQGLSFLPFYRTKLRHNEIKIWCKPDGSYVTSIDYVIQFFIKKYLYEHNNKFPIVAEESFVNSDNNLIHSVLRDIHEIDPSITENELLEMMLPNAISIEEPFWTLDPIDGTFGFLKHEAFSIALSLIYNGRPQIGVLGCPALNTKSERYRVYSAYRNFGTVVYELHNKSEINRLVSNQGNNLSSTLTYCEAKMASLNQQHAKTREIINRINTNHRSLRIDSQYKYALVANQYADIFLRIPAINTPCKIWDHAAGSLILEEAGGMVTDGEGQLLNFCNPPNLQNTSIIIAARDPHLHKRIFDYLR